VKDGRATLIPNQPPQDRFLSCDISWAPDGRSLAFANDETIFTISIDGSELREVTRIATDPSRRPATQSPTRPRTASSYGRSQAVLRGSSFGTDTDRCGHRTEGSSHSRATRSAAKQDATRGSSSHMSRAERRAPSGRRCSTRSASQTGFANPNAGCSLRRKAFPSAAEGEPTGRGTSR
jgi:hypothetical protein